MSYMSALEAAGAKIFRYEYFGDYQGTILVEVEYQDKHGWVSIDYGSIPMNLLLKNLIGITDLLQNS